MSKTLQGQNWDLTPAADGRRYSKYPDGTLDYFPVSAYTPGGSSNIAYQIYDPVALTWGAWIDGEAAGVGGETTQVIGTPLAGPFTFTDQVDVSVDTLIESDAVTISSEGHQIKLRRRSSSSNSAARTAFAVINGVESTAWGITTAASGDPSGDRNDILVEIAFNTFATDQFNPPRMTSTEANKSVDGFRMDNIGNGDWPISQAAKDLPHMEIRGAKSGAPHAANGEHVLEGDKALLLTIYHPDNTPFVDYSVRGDGRARMDAYISSYLATLFNTPRYSANKGFNTEFWFGMALWLPNDFIFDTGVGANLGLLTNGSFSPNSNWGLRMPSLSQAQFMCQLWNIGGVWGNSLDLSWVLSAADMNNLRGKHSCWVFHAKPDTVGTTGFFRGWHNVVGEAPVLRMSASNIKYGYVADGTLPMKAFACYKSGLNSTWNAGTYTGQWTDPAYKLVIGWDSWRMGGDQSNFRSVHPLQQEMPA